MEGTGTREDPWQLVTANGGSEYRMWRGRFGVYLPPLLEALGMADLEHSPRNNRMRAR